MYYLYDNYYRDIELTDGTVREKQVNEELTELKERAELARLKAKYGE